METELALPAGAPVADLGAGTGIFTRLLLDLGWTVWAVEPNAPMRQALAQSLGDHPRLRLSPGSAEATKLADGSVDLVAAAQAFHWFAPAATHREVTRISRPGALFLFVWNARRATGGPFLEAYETFLRRWGTDYARVRERYEDQEVMAALADAGGVSVETFANHQDLDLEGLLGRARSSSYLPGAGHPDHAPMIEALKGLFAAHVTTGTVRLAYETRAYWGRVG
jgi:SAM-dependent methyltransferase